MRPQRTGLLLRIVGVMAMAGVLTTVAVLVGALPALAESGNYVKNSGFETGLSGWSQLPGLTVTSAQAHSGKYSATMTAPTNGAIVTVLNDTPNWLRADAGTDWTKLGLWVKGEPGGVLRLGNGSGFTVLTLTSSDWTQVTAVFDHALYGRGGGGSTSGVDFLAKYSIDNPNASGVIYVDDASETTGNNTTTCSPYVSNCDFEYPYNLQGWNTAGTANEGLSISTDAYSGSQSALLTQNGALGSLTLNDGPNWLSARDIAGAGYRSCTVSAWVKASSDSGGPERILLRTYGGGTKSAYGSAAASTSWQQISATLPVSSTTGSLDLQVAELKVATGGTLNVDHIVYSCARADGSRPGGIGAPPTAGVKALPRLSGLSVSPRRFRAARSGKNVTSSPKRGTKVHYKLNVAASVRFTIERALDGRQVGNRCQAPSRKNHNARRCTRYVQVRGSFTVMGRPGNNNFRFSGRLNGNALAPGKYRLIATPTANARPGSRQPATFAIRR